MKVLITGGEGYIGSNLCNMIPDAETYDIVSGNDILNRCDLRFAICDKDIVVHLAAIPGIQRCEQNPPHAVKENLIGTLNVAELAHLYGVKVIFASSQAVHKPTIYGLTKLLSERIISHFNGVNLRLSNVWGGLNYLEYKDSAIARLNKGTFEDRGHGNEVRDFIHVNEVCEHIIEAFHYPTGTYEVVSGENITINQLIDRFHRGQYRCSPTQITQELEVVKTVD